MDFNSYVKGILQKEILDILEQQDYFLEKDFCTMINQKYKLNLSTIQIILEEVYPVMSLTKRRMTNELKQFYGLKSNGHPMGYMKTNKK